MRVLAGDAAGSVVWNSPSFMGLSSQHINFLPVGLLFTYLFLLFYSWNSKANLSKVNRPVQKAQETARLQSMNFNALHYNNVLFL